MFAEYLKSGSDYEGMSVAAEVSVSIIDTDRSISIGITVLHAQEGFAKSTVDSLDIFL